MPATLARMTRRSRSVSPGELLRTFWNAWKSLLSRASTIRLRTPSCSMKASTCCCAPAPIDIIDTTAATPKIMPSMVSSDRILLAISVSSPRLQSTRICSRAESSKYDASDVIGPLPALARPRLTACRRRRRSPG